MRIENHEAIELDKVFADVEIETPYLEKILKKVLFIINGAMDIFSNGFGPIHEGRIFGNEGVVTETGDIYLDSKKLQKHDEDVAMAIIAHELAHYHLGHYKKTGRDSENQKEADDLAKQWGFNIDKMREIFRLRGIQNSWLGERMTQR
jgi:hypothetical protein